MRDKKYYYGFIVILFTSALASAASGDGGSSIIPWYNLTTEQIFQPASHDISITFLQKIFGFTREGLLPATVAHPNYNPVVVQLMKVLNLGVLLVAGSIVSYSVTSGVIRTAQDGGMSAMGKINAWTVLRVFGGFSVLIPYPNQGFSFIQMLILWVVQHGVGLADHVWDQTLTLLKNEYSNTSPVVLKADVEFDLIKHILNNGDTSLPTAQGHAEVGSSASVYQLAQSATCLAMLKHHQDQYCQQQQKLNKPCSISDNQGYDIRLTNNALQFGSQSQPNICGSYTIANQKEFDLLRRELENIGSSFYASYTALTDNAFAPLPAMSAQQTCSNSPTSGTKGCMESKQMMNLAAVYYSKINYDILASWTQQHGQNSDSSNKIIKNDQYTQLSQQGWASAAKALWLLSDYAGKTSVLPQSMLACKNDIAGCLQKFQLLVANNRQNIGSILTEDENKIYLEKLLPNLGRINQYATQQLTDLQVAAVQAERKRAPRHGQWEQGRNPAGVQIPQSLNEVTSYLLSMLYFDIFTPNNKGKYDQLTGNGFSTESSCTVCLFKKIKVDVAQNNLKVLLVYSLSAFAGLGMYDSKNLFWDNGASDDWSAYSKKSSLALAGSGSKSQLKAACKDSPQSTNCFQTAWDQGGIQNNLSGGGPLGLLGAIGAIKLGINQQGNNGPEKVYHYNPLKNIRMMGIQMLNAAANFWFYLPQGVLTEGKRLMSAYTGNIITGGWISTAVQSGLIYVPYAGVALAGFAQIVTNVFMTVIHTFYIIDLQSLMLYVPIAASVSAIFFLIGTFLAVWVPALPFLIFTLAVIGWVLSVIEAIVAAPLVAMGITYPEGQDFLGQAQQSMVLLLGVFVRPVIILFSFILSFFLFYVIIHLVNIGFVNFLAATFKSFGNQKLGLGGEAAAMIGLITLYCYLLSVIAQYSFSATYKVPEKILIWLGGQPEQSMLPQMLEQVKAGLKSGAEKVGQGGTQGGSAPMQSFGPQMNQNTSKSPDRPDDNESEGSESRGNTSNE